MNLFLVLEVLILGCRRPAPPKRLSKSDFDTHARATFNFMALEIKVCYDPDVFLLKRHHSRVQQSRASLNRIF